MRQLTAESRQSVEFDDIDVGPIKLRVSPHFADEIAAAAMTFSWLTHNTFIFHAFAVRRLPRLWLR